MPAPRPATRSAILGRRDRRVRAPRHDLLAAWQSGGRNDSAFRAMGIAYVRFALASPAHYRVMFGGFVDPQAEDPGLAAEALGAFRALVDALAVLQHDAVVRADDDPVLMARYVWALVHGLAMLGIDGKLPEPAAVEGLMQYAFDRLRTGIAANARRVR